MTTALTRRRPSVVAGVRSAWQQASATYRIVHVVPIVAVPMAAGVIVWRTKADADGAEVLLAAAAAIGLAPVLADRAANVTCATPTSRWWRSSARLVVVIPGVLVWWLVRALSLRAVANAPVLQPPGWDAALVVATFVVAAIAVDVAVDPAGTWSGIAGGLTALVGAVVVARLPSSMALLPIAEHRGRWVATLAVAVLLLATTQLDRGRKRRRFGRMA